MHHQSRKVLHVDDDPQFLRLVGHKLKKHGFEVEALEDGNEAIDRLLSTNCRAVLLDIEMPGINGLDLLREIKQTDGGVQVIMLTGLSTQSTLLRSMRWGATGCLFKPLDDIKECVDLLNVAFDHIDRWWHALEQLQQRSRTFQSNFVSG